MEASLSLPSDRHSAKGQEKGPLASKRPKSREETPKEGGGRRRKSRTALQQDTPQRTKCKRGSARKPRVPQPPKRAHLLAAQRRVDRSGGEDAQPLRGEHEAISL